MPKSLLLLLLVWYYYYRTVLSGNTGIWLYCTVAEAGAEIMDKGGAGAENK